jgi:hypothetical protein
LHSPQNPGSVVRYKSRRSYDFQVQNTKYERPYISRYKSN